jgi:hypothetical protein
MEAGAGRRPANDDARTGFVCRIRAVRRWAIGGMLVAGAHFDRGLSSFPRIVSDEVFLTGSIRYRVKVEKNSLLVRAGSGHRGESFAVGSSVYVGWDREDTLVIQG